MRDVRKYPTENIGKRVKVVRLKDKSAEAKYLTKWGTIIALNTNGLSNQNRAFPLIEIQFKSGIGYFWPDEIKLKSEYHDIPSDR